MRIYLYEISTKEALESFLPFVIFFFTMQTYSILRKEHFTEHFLRYKTISIYVNLS